MQHFLVEHMDAPTQLGSNFSKSRSPETWIRIKCPVIFELQEFEFEAKLILCGNDDSSFLWSPEGNDSIGGLVTCRSQYS